MTFGEVCSGESRARRTLRRSRKPCQGQVVYVEKQGEGTAEAVLFSWLPLTIEEK